MWVANADAPNKCTGWLTAEWINSLPSFAAMRMYRIAESCGDPLSDLIHLVVMACLLVHGKNSKQTIEKGRRTVEENQNISSETLIMLTSDIVTAHVSNNGVALADVPGLITDVYAALANLGAQTEPEEVRPDPAVSIRSSVKPDYIVCLEDGKKLKMLKRYIRTNFDMTPEEYRARWNLPADYPMVAPNYAKKRRDLAKKIGLGRKPGTPTPKSSRAKKTA